jgi:hypothetical protein
MFGRRPEARSLRDEYRSVIEEIENGNPITPRHAQPASVDQDGFASCITDANRAAFAKTAFFGVVLNKSLSWGGWRVQERNRCLLTLFEDPTVGRNLDLYYNAHLAGRVYVYAASLSLAPSLVEPVNLAVAVEIENAQFYPYADISELLRTLAFSVASRPAGEADAARRDLEVDRCLLRALWDITRLPNEPHTIEFYATDGPGNSLIETGELSPETKGKAAMGPGCRGGSSPGGARGV